MLMSRRFGFRKITRAPRDVGKAERNWLTRFVLRILLARSVAFVADSAGAARREQGRAQPADANRCVSRILLTRSVAFGADSAGAAGSEQGRVQLADLKISFRTDC